MEKTIHAVITQRNDTAANWTQNNITLRKGEMGIESDTRKFKFGDGATAWNDLEYVGLAADQNIDATKVYFTQDLIFTQEFGKYAPDATGSVTIPANGKSLKEVLLDAYSEEKQPTVTAPKVSLAAPLNKAYEAGTSVEPTYTVSFNSGGYSYGPATAVTSTGYTVTFNGETLNTDTGTFGAVVVLDNTNLKITAKASHTGGATPNTNLGTPAPDKAIKAGDTAEVSSAAITGYRNTFYGTVTTKGEVTSDVIRGLSGKSNKSLANGAKFAVSIPVGALRVLIAYPATLKDLASVTDRNGMNAAITSSFTKLPNMTVKGAGADAGIDYKVYQLDFAEANNTVNNFDVTI